MLGEYLNMDENTDTLIDKIQEVRSGNNKYWMDLVKLAFKLAPDEAKAILSNITVNDNKINLLCKEIVDE